MASLVLEEDVTLQGKKKYWLITCKNWKMLPRTDPQDRNWKNRCTTLQYLVTLWWTLWWAVDSQMRREQRNQAVSHSLPFRRGIRPA